MPLDDFNLSVRTHNVIYKIAAEATVDMYPLPRYATVTAVNHATGKATVQYPDEAGTFVLSTMMIAPEVGAVVRVNGDMGARFIDEIKSGSLRIRGALAVTGAISGTTAAFSGALSGTTVALTGALSGTTAALTGAVTVGSLSSAGQLTLPNGGNSLGFATDGSYLSFHNAGYANRRGYLQGNAAGMILNSESGFLSLIGAGGLNLSGGRVDFGGGAITGMSGVINGYTMSTDVLVNRVVLASPAGYIFGNYFNMTADTGSTVASMTHVAGMISNDNFIRWFPSLRLSRGDFQASGAWWSTCSISASPTVGVAAISFHTGGAPMIGSSAGFGNNLYHRDSVWTPNTATCYSAGWASDSSRLWKKNITKWPLSSGGAAVESAVDLLCKLTPITYQLAARDIEVQSDRRTRAWGRLNSFNENRGKERYELPEHDCSIHECAGTIDSPCTRHVNHHRERLGMTAEEVFEVIPQACSVDLEMKPVSIEYGQLTVVAIAAIQELTERIKVLEEVNG